MKESILSKARAFRLNQVIQSVRAPSQTCMIIVQHPKINHPLPVVEQAILNPQVILVDYMPIINYTIMIIATTI